MLPSKIKVSDGFSIDSTLENILLESPYCRGKCEDGDQRKAKKLSEAMLLKEHRNGNSNFVLFGTITPQLQEGETVSKVHNWHRTFSKKRSNAALTKAESNNPSLLENVLHEPAPKIQLMPLDVTRARPTIGSNYSSSFSLGVIRVMQGLITRIEELFSYLKKPDETFECASFLAKKENVDMSKTFSDGTALSLPAVNRIFRAINEENIETFLASKKLFSLFRAIEIKRYSDLPYRVIQNRITEAQESFITALELRGLHFLPTIGDYSSFQDLSCEGIRFFMSLETLSFQEALYPNIPLSKLSLETLYSKNPTFQKSSLKKSASFPLSISEYAKYSTSDILAKYVLKLSTPEIFPLIKNHIELIKIGLFRLKFLCSTLVRSLPNDLEKFVLVHQKDIEKKVDTLKKVDGAMIFIFYTLKEFLKFNPNLTLDHIKHLIRIEIPYKNKEKSLHITDDFIRDINQSTFLASLDSKHLFLIFFLAQLFDANRKIFLNQVIPLSYWYSSTPGSSSLIFE